MAGITIRRQAVIGNSSIPRNRVVPGKTRRRFGYWNRNSYLQPGRLEMGALMKYAIVTERAENNYSVYVPDLPGCIARGASIEEVEQEIREAIEFHLDGMRKDGEPIPPPRSH